MTQDTLSYWLASDGELFLQPLGHAERVGALGARLLLPGPTGAVVAALRAVQQDPALTPEYGAQVAVEGLELATLHIIRNESPEVVASFAGKLPVLIWAVRG